ncbi:uncharacterized protein LOC124254018 [Haliotis rubra]|uniref:uncharacterized protein LOC124254018 n=1 Tax=Haliotis rubra TaxID=36100 RepID=UPI001EE5B2E3|nr:uncharacterized protein LOC124254018 [Haliotis rubra]
MGAARISDDIYSRRQQERCLFNKVQFGSVIEGTNSMPEDKDKSCEKLPNNAKTAQLNYTACLNTNNNGYTREEGDCDVDPANSSVLGSKSDQGFSRGPDASRNKPRHSYLNKRHSDGHRSRNRKPTGAEGAYADYDKTCLEPEQRKANTAEDTGHLTDPTLQQCHRRDPKLTQRKDERTLSPIKSDPELSLESSAIHKDCTPQNDASQLNTVFQNDVQGEETTFKELFQDISHFNSLCDIPDSMKKSVLQLICTPFLSGGYSSGLCVLSNLIKSSLSSPGQAIQNQEHHVDQCGSSEGTAQVHTGRSIDSEEFSPVQVERDLWYREPNNMRSGKCTVIEDNPTQR